MSLLAEGQAWTVLHGDCLEILPALADGFADAIVTDPPYGVGFTGKATKWTGPSGGYLEHNDTREAVRDVVVPVIASLVARGLRVVLTPGFRCLWLYPEPRQLGVIYYPSGAGSGPWGFSCSQPILYYGKDPYLSHGLGGRPDSFSSFETTEAGIDHPCPKPVGVASWLVAKASLENEIVLDPFCGSGTTGVACLRLGRRFIGIEKDAKYAAIARERLEAEDRGLSLRDARHGQTSIFDALKVAP
jgi:DNA modification methylase